MARRVHTGSAVEPAYFDPGEDAAFDELLPTRLQLKASLHFTPIDVAQHAARLLAPKPGTMVLDVGSGVGKFCIAAALAAPQAQFVGVEWRQHLVRLAERLARAKQLSNARFIHADAIDLDWSEYHSFYLYNPFAEQLFSPAFVLDRRINFDPANFILYVSAVRTRLAAARIGTRLVTYHGFGGPPPLGYELVREEAIGTDRLELWIKTRAVAECDAKEDAA
jgi:SAM-dependent methyltransferase